MDYNPGINQRFEKYQRLSSLVTPLSQVLTNLGDRILELIGEDQYRLMKALEKDTSDQEALVRLCINIHTEVGLLRNKETRNIIFNSLSMDDARELAFVLGLEYEGTPY